MKPEMDESANLQPDAEPKTAKQWAKKLGVSERQLFKAGEVMRYRPDLMDKVTAKEMSLHAAWLEATCRQPDTSWDRLVRAWNSATDEDHARFMEELGFPGEARAIRSRIAICLPDGTANLQGDAE